MIASWLRGADVLGAIQAGSNAGLQLRAAALREAAQQAEERRAADALALNYAQLDAQNQRAALSQQAQTERSRASDALQALRDRELGRHHLATEQKSAADLLRLAAEDKAQQEHNAATLAETKAYHEQQNKAAITPVVKEISPGVKVVQLGPNHWQLLTSSTQGTNVPKTLSVADAQDLKALDVKAKQIHDEMQAAFPVTPQPTSKRFQDYQSKTNSLAEIDKKREAIVQKYRPKETQPTGPVKVSTKEERDALKPGTEYIGPDGLKAVKQ